MCTYIKSKPPNKRDRKRSTLHIHFRNLEVGGILLALVVVYMIYDWFRDNTNCVSPATLTLYGL